MRSKLKVRAFAQTIIMGIPNYVPCTHQHTSTPVVLAPYSHSLASRMHHRVHPFEVFVLS